MKYFYVEPEVAGGLGENAEIDHSVRPFQVLRLHYHLDGWLGDVLLESFPVFIITENAKNRLQEAGFSGAAYDEVQITTSYEFKQLYPRRTLPAFAWMKIEGAAGHDDFGIAMDRRLVISERAIDVLRQLGIPNAEIAPFDDSPAHSEQ